MFGTAAADVLGPPLASKDPRPEFASCLEKTVRNKINKMTYLHIYFLVNQRGCITLTSTLSVDLVKITYSHAGRRDIPETSKNPIFH